MTEVFSRDDVGPGTWLWGRYGFDSRLFYVVAVVGSDAIVSSPTWLTSANVTIPLGDIGPTFSVVGRTRYRWWRALLFPIKALIPLYPKPRDFAWY